MKNNRRDFLKIGGLAGLGLKHKRVLLRPDTHRVPKVVLHSDASVAGYTRA